jgi:carbon-monoxide dehydrogenase medium subunit
MRIRPFEYVAVSSVEEALDRLAHYGSDAKVLAGGTDLVLALKHKTVLPRVVINLFSVKALNFIRDEGTNIRIGALTRHKDLIGNATVRRDFPALCEAVSLIGSWQIRNVATIGGNLCTASPAADSAPPLLALDTKAVIIGPDGEKEMPLNSFFSGPGETAMGQGCLLKEIVIQKPKQQAAGRYLKLMRKNAVDLALVGVAFQAETDETGERLARVAIGLGGVAPTPIRAAEAEEKFLGLSYTEALKAIPDAAEAAVAATRPISDVRASADYRRAVVSVYVKRAAEIIFGTLFHGETI